MDKEELLLEIEKIMIKLKEKELLERDFIGIVCNKKFKKAIKHIAEKKGVKLSTYIKKIMIKQIMEEKEFDSYLKDLWK